MEAVKVKREFAERPCRNGVERRPGVDVIGERVDLEIERVMRDIDPIVRDSNRKYFPDARVSVSIGGLVGALLGCLAAFYGGPTQQGTKFGRTWLGRSASALILVALGVFLVANGSKFVLFTLNLDPRQLLAAFLIGGFAGVGAIDVISFVKDLGRSGRQRTNP